MNAYILYFAKLIHQKASASSLLSKFYRLLKEGFFQIFLSSGESHCVYITHEKQTPVGLNVLILKNI